MQVKIIIGTIAFMLTMIILGFAALKEPSRLQEFTAAAEARSIESGAQVFTSNCATCHGVDGRAETCFDTAGNQIPCKGRPLNDRGLVCGDPSKRMVDLQWTGAKLDFIESTVKAGRPWAGMPTWGQEFGGPLQPDQVADVARFIMNWESDSLCNVAAPEFPWPDTFEGFVGMTELPAEVQAQYDEAGTSLSLPVAFPGDATRGAELYNVTYGCVACHGKLEDPATAVGPGPHLGNIGVDGATRKEGYTAEDYVYESVLHPGDFIAPRCPTPDGVCPNAMPGNFAARMGENPQDLADIMTYVLKR